ncbi:MAG: DUF1080 domain-containing protein [Candidatus Omnitrophica bacterium]|nr:DUF1080 domain-containing protein [Candidatus Omnitrophota bacterium]
MRYSMAILVLLMVGAPSMAGEWIHLIQKDGMKGWQGDTGTWKNVSEAWAAKDGSKKIDTSDDGSGILVNGPDGKTVNLFSEMEHGDLEAKIEFMVPPESNSGVYFMGRYEVQVLDSWGEENPTYADCGGIYQRWKDDHGYEGVPPRVNASRPPGEWQSFHVIFRAPRFDADGYKTENAKFIKVVHNDQVVHENVEVTGPTRAAAFEDEQSRGPLMFQGDHGPVAYRNIQVRHLDLEDK